MYYRNNVGNLEIFKKYFHYNVKLCKINVIIKYKFNAKPYPKF